MKNVGLFGGCQLTYTYNFFLNNEVCSKNDFNIKFALSWFEYDKDYWEYKGTLDYNIFDNLDILIISNNPLSENNQASNKKIINYVKTKNKNTTIIKTVSIRFSIFPINWNGYGENKNDYINWTDLHKIDYKDKFKKCVNTVRKQINKTHLHPFIADYIEENFNKEYLFSHCMHPTNVLFYQIWKSLFICLKLNIEDYQYNFEEELVLNWLNPFTKKMMKDLNIQFDSYVDDDFYIKRYNENKHLFLTNEEDDLYD